MRIGFFGSSIVSAYWNGAATYYRGIVKALHHLGHKITFFEPDAYDRQNHLDLHPPSWVEVVVYANSKAAALQQVEAAIDFDLVIKTSGVGVFDDLLEEAILGLKTANRQVVFWDVDAPATLDRVLENANDPFRMLIPQYDFILTYGGGEPVKAAYKALGAKACYPIYNALDPETHFPVPAVKNYQSDLSFLANRLPDREARADEFFFKAANLLRDKRILLAGNGWHDKAHSDNIIYLGHLYTAEHNAFNCSARAVLNVNRLSMAQYGFSPATRVFEAAGAGACIISDQWRGIEEFFEPGREILLTDNGQEVAETLNSLSLEHAKSVGAAAFKRVLSKHTYAERAKQFERIMSADLVS